MHFVYADVSLGREKSCAVEISRRLQLTMKICCATGMNTFVQVLNPAAFGGFDAFEQQTSFIAASARASPPVAGGNKVIRFCGPSPLPPSLWGVCVVCQVGFSLRVDQLPSKPLRAARACVTLGTNAWRNSTAAQGSLRAARRGALSRYDGGTIGSCGRSRRCQRTSACLTSYSCCFYTIIKDLRLPP